VHSHGLSVQLRCRSDAERVVHLPLVPPRCLSGAEAEIRKLSQPGRCRVLIVEDEYFLANDLAKALSASGAQVVGPIADLEEAVAQVGQGGFDVECWISICATSVSV